MLVDGCSTWLSWAVRRDRIGPVDVGGGEVDGLLPPNHILTSEPISPATSIGGTLAYSNWNDRPQHDPRGSQAEVDLVCALVALLRSTSSLRVQPTLTSPNTVHVRPDGQHTQGRPRRYRVGPHGRRPARRSSSLRGRRQVVFKRHAEGSPTAPQDHPLCPGLLRPRQPDVLIGVGCRERRRQTGRPQERPRASSVWT